MMAVMNGVLLALLVIGFTGFVIWLGAGQARKTRENLGRLTEKPGLQLNAAEPRLGIFWSAPAGRGTFKRKQGALTYVEQGSFAAETVCAHFEPAAALLRDLADVAEICAQAG